MVGYFYNLLLTEFRHMTHKFRLNDNVDHRYALSTLPGPDFDHLLNNSCHIFRVS